MPINSIFDMSPRDILKRTDGSLWVVSAVWGSPVVELRCQKTGKPLKFGLSGLLAQEFTNTGEKQKSPPEEPEGFADDG